MEKLNEILIRFYFDQIENLNQLLKSGEITAEEFSKRYQEAWTEIEKMEGLDKKND